MIIRTELIMTMIAEPTPGDLEGWLVRVVVSGSCSPACIHVGDHGTYSLVRSDVESFNDLVRDVDSFSKLHGYRAQSSRIVDGTFRWTWESVADDHRVSDMIIASKIV